MVQGRVETSVPTSACNNEINSNKADGNYEQLANFSCGQPTVVTSKVNFGCPDNWGWSSTNKSSEVRLYGDDSSVAHFHPSWSSGTAGVFGSRPLDGRRYYWELQLSQRVFGTSIMFGVATAEVRVHADSFKNMLGEDGNGWGLSHKGLLWHDGNWCSYTRPFPENQATTIGLLFDGVAGTLTYYKDGVCLGVAFRNLNSCQSTLYPFVCSTAAKTKISLSGMRRDFVNLQDRCRDVIVRNVKTRGRLNKLRLPARLMDYLSQGLPREKPRVFKAAHLNTILDM